jgi:hypothetical protein
MMGSNGSQRDELAPLSTVKGDRAREYPSRARERWNMEESDPDTRQPLTVADAAKT